MAIVVPIVSEWNPKGIDRSIADIQKAEGTWGKVGAGFEKAFVPAAAALAGLGAAGLSFAKEAEQAAQASARLNQTLSNQGVAAGAIKRQEELASSISRTTGVSDDLIKAGQAQLATFGSVASSAGTMGGMFDRATQAGVDLAAAGFGSIESNAVQLGKALEDPTKGLTALGKAGVTFTDQEKEQIAALQEAGDLLGAQEIVLAAVEKQVGGTGEATATASGKMSNAFGEAGESIGTALLPAFEELSGYLTMFADWAGENGPALAAIGATIAGIAGAVVLVNAAMKVYQAVAAIVTAVQWAMNAAFLANPITWIILAIVALVAAIVILWKKNEAFRNALIAIWNAIKAAASAVFGWLKSAWDSVAAAFESAANGIKAVFTGLWNFLKGIFDKIKGMWDGVKNIISKIPGLNSVTGNASFGYAVPASVTSYSAAGTRASSTASASAGVVVNVSGAVDPERTARQIRRLLDQSDIRQGRSSRMRVAAW